MGISRKRELDLGRHTYDDLVHSMSPAILPSRHPEAKRVRAIVRRLAATVKKIDPSLSDGFEWAVVVADVPEPNALCAPGGKILITTGILNILPTEDHVAIVLAHEIAHALNRHGAESMHLQRMLIPIIILLNDIFDSRWLGSLVVQLLMALPYSRRLELEADHVGLILSTEACFDPRVAPDVFSSLAAVQGERPETGVGKLKPFFSTHPQSTDRAQRLNRMLPERVAKYESSCVVPRRFVEQYAYPPPQPFPENW